MDSSKLKIIVIIALAAVFSLYLGIAAATAQTEAIAWVVGIAGLAGVLALGKNVWVLIPMTLGIEGGINVLPGSPMPWWIATFIACAMLTLRFVMRTKDLIYRFTWLDFAILLQAVAVGQAWIRHPAGFSIFGGDTVGGKQNLVFTLSFIAYAVLGTIRTDLVMFKRSVILTIVLGTAAGILYMLTEYSPAVAMVVLPIWSGAAFTTGTSATGAAEGGLDTTRFGAGAVLGKALGPPLLTMYVPSSLFNPLRFWRFSLFMLTLAFTAISGFRSGMGMLAFLFVTSTLVRRRPMDLVVGLVASVLLLSVLIVTGGMKGLPFGAQRILAALPIEVSAEAKRSGEETSDWRFDMWREALTSDRYIHDKFLGDGVSYSAAEQRAADDSTVGDMRRSAGLTMQEIMLVRGAFHGFHVETIRCTGVFGLILALVGMGIFFKTALRLINYYRYRPEWMYVLYIGIPFLIHPFFKMLVFGAYRGDFPVVLASAGMLKILDNIRYMEVAAAAAETHESSRDDVQRLGYSAGRGLPQSSPT